MPPAVSPSAAVPPPAADPRPVLVLVAVDMGRDAPTETGKAWNWACALARHWRLHIVTGRSSVERCRAEPAAAGWHWHPTAGPSPTAMGWRYYRDYARWCRGVSAQVADLGRTLRPAHLHHITLGSFRVLPRYDRCGVPYSLGPLGGGEAVPWDYLRSAGFPPRAWLTEWLRPWLNRAAAGVPALRAVVGGAVLALGTTPESERVLRRMGARRTAVVFPDRVPSDMTTIPVEPAASRAAALARGVRLVWSGRALWWKGGQLAIELLRRLTAAGVSAELTIYSYGPALAAWQRQLAASGVAERCRVRGFVPRPELLAELGRAHALVYPTLHDSSSSALLETYALGVPSLTTGVGGPAVVATPETGYNVRAAGLDAWLDGAVAHLRRWQREPATWLAASAAARVRAGEFSADYLDRAVARRLAPEALVS